VRFRQGGMGVVLRQGLCIGIGASGHSVVVSVGFNTLRSDTDAYWTGRLGDWETWRLGGLGDWEGRLAYRGNRCHFSIS